MEYIRREMKDHEPPTVNGLCFYLGIHRDTLNDYERNKGADFSDTIGTLKAGMGAIWERQLYRARNPSGAIFWLKNQGWTDKSEVHRTGAPETVVNNLGALNERALLAVEDLLNGPCGGAANPAPGA
jgi:hypothetical protein